MILIIGQVSPLAMTFNHNPADKRKDIYWQKVYQYNGAVMSAVTVIIRINLRWSVPALRSLIIRSWSFGPITNSPATGPCVVSNCGSHLLSLFSQEFIGFRMPLIAASQPHTSVFSIFSIFVLPFSKFISFLFSSVRYLIPSFSSLKKSTNWPAFASPNYQVFRFP